MKISIIIGYYNRKKQLLYTLKTINESLYKNIEIIIIDDCSDNIEDILYESDFKIFNMEIKLISIKKEEKTWINPCVGYNKGISQSTGDIIILQNAEVCHIGDCISYVVNNLKTNDWLTFNCYGLNNFEENEYIYSQNNKKEIYKFINKIWKDDEYTLKPGGNQTFNNKVGGWLNHFLYHFVAYHYFGAIYRDDLMNKMNGGFDLDYSDGICFDDNDFVKRLIFNKIRLTINEFSEYEPFTIHLYHEKSTNIINNKKKWSINSTIYQKKCENMNISSDWRLYNFMPNPILYNNKEINYSNINILIGIIIDDYSKILILLKNLIYYVNNDLSFLFYCIKNIKLNIVFCINEKNNIEIKKIVNFFEQKIIYYKYLDKISKNIINIDYSSDNKINIDKIKNYKDDLTLKLFINRGTTIYSYPHNILENL